MLLPSIKDELLMESEKKQKKKKMKMKTGDLACLSLKHFAGFGKGELIFMHTMKCVSADLNFHCPECYTF